MTHPPGGDDQGVRPRAGASSGRTTPPLDAARPGFSTWNGLPPQVVRDAAADRLKALSHPDRLRIVEALAAGPKTVSEIGATVGRSMNAVSRHLRVLRDARVVQCSKRGNSVLYVLADRDVARLAAIAYRGAGGQVRRVAALAEPGERPGAHVGVVRPAEEIQLADSKEPSAPR